MLAFADERHLSNVCNDATVVYMRSMHVMYTVFQSPVSVRYILCISCIFLQHCAVFCVYVANI